VESPRNGPSPNQNTSQSNFWDLASLWQAIAGKSLDIMLKGGDPYVEEMPLPGSTKKPSPVFALLRAATKRLCNVASQHDEQFRQDNFQQLVRCVYRWCCGDRTPENLVNARMALDMALVDLNRASRMARRNVRADAADKARSNWTVDDRILETLKTVGRRLSTTKLISAMNARGRRVSVSTVKKRLALMVREKRLTNDTKAKPRGYGLREWDHSAGS
jgi:hypothetical protein